MPGTAIAYSYAMSGTEIAYGATGDPACNIKADPPRGDRAQQCMVVERPRSKDVFDYRTRYLSAYAPATRCPVLTSYMVLSATQTSCGSQVDAALSAYAICLRYLPTLYAYAICLRYLPTLCNINAICLRYLPTLSAYATYLRSAYDISYAV
eukprot:462835-Rhodomonas_salina.3